MTPETVRRYWVHDDYYWPSDCAELIQEMNDDDSQEAFTSMVLASDYDLFHAQAVALAKRVMSIDHSILSCASNRDLFDGVAEECNCIKQQAQEILEGT